MSSPGPSPTVRKETSHTVSLVLPHLAPETSVLVLGLGIYGSFIWNAILAGVARLVTYAATCLALIQLRRQRPQADRWRAPAVAVIGTANWLVVRSRPPLTPGIKTA